MFFFFQIFSVNFSLNVFVSDSGDNDLCFKIIISLRKCFTFAEARQALLLDFSFFCF